MVEHKIKGGFLQKFFPTKNAEIPLTVSFPSDMKELSQLAREGKLVIEGMEFPITAESLCTWAWRGFSLQHQGGGTISEEQKAENALNRKAEREALKEMKQKAEVKEAIARKKAELLAAQGK